MFPDAKCFCPLCRLEVQLFASLDGNPLEPHVLSSGRQKPWNAAALLAELRSSNGNGRSDELFREILALRAADPQPADGVLILAFLPMLHRTARRIGKRQESLSAEDIAQQTLTTFLNVLHSRQLRERTSHIAFAIARAVKRKMFEWASRESLRGDMRAELNGEALEIAGETDALERHTALRHFLNSCVKKRFLTDSEVNLLVQSRLDGANGDHAAKNASNAERQRLKRLLAKLRTLAR